MRRFNAGQSRDYVQAVYQGDYFEGLAKLRTAIQKHDGDRVTVVLEERLDD